VKPQNGEHRLYRKVRDVLVHSAGLGIYFVILQLGVFALLARRLTPAEFGRFGLLYTLGALVSSTLSRTLIQTATRFYYPTGSGGVSHALQIVYTWGLAGVLGLLVAPILVMSVGEWFGLSSSPTITEIVGIGVFTGSQVSFDSVVSMLRMERRFVKSTFVTLNVGISIVVLVWAGGDSYGNILLIGLGTLLGVATGLPWFAGHLRRFVEAGLEGSRERFRKALRTFGILALATLGIRYADRLAVGHVLGEEAIGVFFAVSNGVAIAVFPIQLLESYLQGLLAKSHEQAMFSLPRKRLVWMSIGVAIASPAFTVPIAALVITILYPFVSLPSLLLSFIAYGIARTWYSLRAVSVPVVNRFGDIELLAKCDSVALAVEIGAVLMLAPMFGLTGGFYGSSLGYVAGAALSAGVFVKMVLSSRRAERKT